LTVFNRANLLIVFVAILGAALGLLAGSRFGQAPEIAAPAGMAILKPGDTRANLQLPDLDDQPRQLSDWDGKLVLLNFWATWCGPCRDEMPLLNATGTKFSPQGLQVVGIAIDDADAVKDYLKTSPVRYPILIGGDEDPNASVLFGDTRGVLPYSVLIGRDGRLLAQRSGSFSSSELTNWVQPHLRTP
jgi:thiol-disulfide isomerase/thioredoxin